MLDGPGFQIVSGNHARFSTSAGSWWIEDLGSTNGTYLNGDKVDSLVEVRDGDRLELGRPRKRGEVAAVRFLIQLTSDLTPAFASDLEQGDIDPLDCTLISAPSAVDLEATSEFDPGTVSDSDVGFGDQTILTTHEAPSRAPASSGGLTEETAGFDMDATIQRSPSPESPRQESPSPQSPSPQSPSPEPLREEPLPAAVTPPARSSSSAAPIDLRGKLDEIRAANRRLGALGYRLDTLVEELQGALLEAVADGDRDAEIATSDEGQALRALVVERRGLARELDALTAELPKLEAQSREELAPLARAAEEAKRQADAARTRFEEAETRTRNDQGAYERHVEGARGLIVGALEKVVEPRERDAEPTESTDAAGSTDPSGVGTPWRGWSAALKEALEGLELRTEALDSASEALQESTEASERARAGMADACAAAESAQAEAEHQRARLEASIAENKARTTAAQAQLSESGKDVQRRATELVRASLGASGDATLGALPAHDEAGQLAEEIDTLERELRVLEADLGR